MSHIGPMQTLKVAMSTGGAQALLVGTLPRVGCQPQACHVKSTEDHA